jgi:phosphoribosylformylglycinamidine synthase II/phosphoribosylformylglycinamidine synthase I
LDLIQKYQPINDAQRGIYWRRNKMSTYRIEIRNQNNLEVNRSRLYFVKAPNLEQSAVERLCREVLCDPVTESFTVGARHASPLRPVTSFFELTLQAGVTDSAAESLLEAAKILGIPLEAAATGERFEYPIETTLEQLKLLAHERANEVIERFTLNQEITPPFVEHAILSSAAVEYTDLRGATDERLLEVSKERRLALDLLEMQAVKAYYERENRPAADVELEMIAQTWSEHCVHKTFRARIETNTGEVVNGLLKSFIAKATKDLNKSWVRSAFVDNAGIIEFDDDFDVAVKVETHNHPSALEPFGGANTGVGGVIRDVLALGAKPIANMDVLCFGNLEQEFVPDGVLHPKRIQEGVVRGIEDYGNKMGIPTVNGAVLYHKGYTANPLVYCGCVGILPASPKNAKPLEAKAGDLIIALGGRTGRDGLRGATFSSLEMDTSTAEIASTSVQIGQPITEKKVQEVILRAKKDDLYTAMTDCGAGGFSSAVGEMGKDLGAYIRLENALLKYPGLRPWEIWLSEAQERMVLSVPLESLSRLQALCDSQDVELVHLGEFTDSRRLILTHNQKTVGELDLEFLHEGIPQRQLKATVGAGLASPLSERDPREIDPELDLLNLLAHPNIRSREKIIRLFDHEIKGGTAVKPLVGAANHGPSDAAVIIPNPGKSKKALAISNGICPQFGLSDPYAMTWAAIDEAVRNAVCVGANPDQIAILDNFCWGNPTLPDRLGSLLETSRACYDAALVYGTPFVSGKDSLYNEYTDEDGNKHAIPGTLLISAIGILPDASKTVTMDFKQADNLIYVLGETRDELGQSHYTMLHDLEGGTVPQPVQNPLKRYRALHQAIQAGLIQSAHDCSEGGLAVALAEMCLAGRLGAAVDFMTLEPNSETNQPLDFTTCAFSETAGRIILEVRPEDSDALEALFADIPLSLIGAVQEALDDVPAQFTMYFAGENIVDVDIQTLELSWRDELAPTPIPTVGAQRAAPLPKTQFFNASPDSQKPNANANTGRTQGSSPTKTKTMIIHANGSNRDHDAALAVELAGGNPEIVHLNQLFAGERKLEDYGFLIVPGGFSYGDDLGAGVMWALALREGLGEQLENFVSSGKPVLGICNGFQTLVKAGVLPGGFEPRTSTLTYNAQGHFECRWVTLEANQSSSSFWLSGLEDGMDTPIAHGEGRFLCDETTLAHLETHNLVALRYVGEDYPANPNGSLSRIAGITNAAGNVLGLMPHPENHIFDWQHPRYHRGERGRTGLKLFENALRQL